MSHVTTLSTSVTLADHLTGGRSVARSTLLVAGAAAFVGLSAQISVPLWPVPITAQTLAVLIVGSALGAGRGALALALYAVVGALGLPWFSGGTAGWHIIAGPTGGYIIGFVAAAALAGALAQRRWDRRFLPATLLFLAATLVPFLTGLPWLSVVLGLDFEHTLQAGLYPFVVGGIIKTAVATLVLPLAWRVTNGGGDLDGGPVNSRTSTAPTNHPFEPEP